MDEELKRRFVYHAPTEETRAVHEEIRAEMLAFARTIVDTLQGPSGQMPASREVSLALTALEECSFWAHAHVARNLQ